MALNEEGSEKKNQQEKITVLTRKVEKWKLVKEFREKI